jgi:hypothetical protein
VKSGIDDLDDFGVQAEFRVIVGAERLRHGDSLEPVDPAVVDTNRLELEPPPRTIPETMAAGAHLLEGVRFPGDDH